MSGEDMSYHELFETKKIKFKPNLFYIRNLEQVLKTNNSYLISVKHVLSRYTAIAIMYSLVNQFSDFNFLVVSRAESSREKVRGLFDVIEMAEVVGCYNGVVEKNVTLVEFARFDTVDVTLYDCILFDHCDMFFEGEELNEYWELLREYSGRLIYLGTSFSPSFLEQIEIAAPGIKYTVLCNEDMDFSKVKNFYIQLSDMSSDTRKLERKLKVLMWSLETVPFDKCVIFSNNENHSQRIFERLKDKQWPCVLNQIGTTHETIKNMEDIRIIIGSDALLSSTDLFGDLISLIIHIDMPTNCDLFQSRLACTGRLGITGISLTIGQKREVDILRRFSRNTFLTVSPLPKKFTADHFIKDLYSMPNNQKSQLMHERKTKNELEFRSKFKPPILQPGSSFLINTELPREDLSPTGTNAILFDRSKNENTWEDCMDQVVKLSKEEFEERIAFFTEKLNLPFAPKNISRLLQTEKWTPPGRTDVIDRITEWRSTLHIAPEQEEESINLTESTPEDRSNLSFLENESESFLIPKGDKQTGLLPKIAYLIKELTSTANNDRIYGCDFDS